MAGDPHENLLTRIMDAHPGALSAECCYGQVTIQRNASLPMQTRCPVCWEAAVRVGIARFTPPRFREQISIPEPVAEWAGRGAKAEGLYLAGPVGTGKTHTAWMAVRAWCIAADIVPRGEDENYDGYSGRTTRIAPTVIFARMTDLLDDFRPNDDSVQHVRDCQHASLLVVDDLGAEKPSEWTQERLYSVIDHRYANCLPLLVTGNLPPAKLAEQTGDRVGAPPRRRCARSSR